MAEDDLLILVDEQNQVLGFAPKADCHDGEGKLHRAFSIFLFNGRGHVLIQERSEEKRLWSGFWSNSCCSHPRKGEVIAEAAVRRLREELGVETELQLLYEFIYHERFGNEGSEWELCSVLIGKSDAPIEADPAEIAEWRYVEQEELDRELHERPEAYTPWFRMEWERIRGEHQSAVDNL